MKIEIYDNKGKTVDRYTVVITEGKWFDVYTMAENPSVFNQYAFSNQPYNKGGKSVLFNNLPLAVRNAITDRMISEGGENI